MLPVDLDQILTSQELQAVLGLGLFTGALLVLVIFLFIFLRQKNNQRESELAAATQQQALRGQLHDSELQMVKLESRLQELEKTEARLAEQQRANQSLEREYASLKAQFAAEQTHFESQLAILRSAKESLTKEFENIANKIFETKQQQFKQSSQSSLEVTINPLKEQIKEFRKQVEDVYHRESAERNKLVGQISELQKQAQQIGQDAVNLATALKGSNKTQGNWGEVILERLLEESGLHKGREYETQVALKDEHGQRRNPDVIIRLPENKDIVIDAKVSLLHYEAFCSSETDSDRQVALKQHITSIRSHIDGLSRKNYESLEAIRTLDFVFIFVPIESAFMLAMEHDQGLFQYAYDRHIVLVSPTTLMATLRTVENIWRYEKQNKNAEKIASMAGALHDQFVLVMNSLEDLGATIDKTQQAYTKTRQRLHTGKGNLFKRIQDLEKLGAKTKRALPKVDSTSIELMGLPSSDEDDETDNITDDIAADSSEDNKDE